MAGFATALADRLRGGYAELLAILLTRRIIVPVFAMAILALGTVMYVVVGRDFFPVIDGGQILGKPASDGAAASVA